MILAYLLTRKSKKPGTTGTSTGGAGVVVTDSLIRTTQAYAKSYGLKPSILLGIADHESGLDPYAKNPESSARGAWQMMKATAEGLEPGSYAAILGGDIETQTRLACQLFIQNRAVTGDEKGAVGAWWSGASGYKRILAGEVVTGINLSMMLDYINDVYDRSAKYTYLD